MKEHSAICVRLFTVYEQSDLSYSLGPKDDARSICLYWWICAKIAPVELQSKFEDKIYMYCSAHKPHSIKPSTLNNSIYLIFIVI